MSEITRLIAERIDNALGFVLDALATPTADIRASLLVLGILLLLVTLAGVAGYLAWLAVKERRQLRAEAAAAAETSGETGDGGRPAKSAKRRPLTVASVLTSVIWLTFLVAAVWVAAGVTTGSSTACESCHSDSPHLAAREIDRHAKVACIQCHEPGGSGSKVMINLPGRLTHFVEGSSQPQGTYGIPVSSAGCTGCHRKSLAKVTRDSKTGVRMSHREPTKAGAECVDCHTLSSGVVTKRTVGMNPCLRCHDGRKAASKCDTCHTRDPAQATVSAETTSGALAQRLVPDPQCSGCHDMVVCDKCHGISMPHTPEFMGTGHAREAVVDLWDNGGRTCSNCHFEGRRACTDCHQQAFLAHGPQFKEGHKTADWSGTGCSCHEVLAPIRGRNLCVDCHPTKPASAVEASAN